MVEVGVVSRIVKNVQSGMWNEFMHACGDGAELGVLRPSNEQDGNVNFVKL